MRQKTYARVHRTYDWVVFDTNNSLETAYLSVSVARELATLLIKYADDVEDCDFTDSTLGTRFAGKDPEQE